MLGAVQSMAYGERMVANRELARQVRLPKRGLKRSEYDALVELGLFEDERVELLFGEIVPMSPQKPPHRILSQRVQARLTVALFGRANVQGHSPIYAAHESEPEPDVAVYDPADDQHGHPQNIHLVVEVTQSSRRRDRIVKRDLYALSGFPEYWIIDVKKRELRVMRGPSGDDYGTVTTHQVGTGAVVALLAFPDVTVALDDLFQGL